MWEKRGKHPVSGAFFVVFILGTCIANKKCVYLHGGVGSFYCEGVRDRGVGVEARLWAEE